MRISHLRMGPSASLAPLLVALPFGLIIWAVISVTASTASAVTLQFSVTLDMLETTGTLATGNDGAFVPVSFSTEVEVDLDSVAPFGPEVQTGPGFFFRSGATFATSGSSTPTSQTTGLVAQFPGLDGEIDTNLGGDVTSYDSLDVLGGGVNESFSMRSATGSLTEIESIAGPGNIERHTTASYQFRFSREGLYEEGGLPADRTFDATTLLADYLFPGATFDVRETFSTDTLDFLGGFPDLTTVQTGGQTYRGTATLISVIPEPSTALLLGLGLIGLGRKNRK